MVDSSVQAGSEGSGAHLVLYDGVCGLCSRLVQFLLAHDRRAVFNFASLQSATGQAVVEQAGGDVHQLTTFYVFANYRTPAARLLKKSDAALFMAGELGRPWKAARFLRLVPKTFRDRLYDVVARTRYRVFGRYEQCRMPPAEFRSRFVD
jgi:predicted DCC family thiol-disulfide oxidoreductase YuxK